MNIAPISQSKAKSYFKRYSAFRGPFDMALCVMEGKTVHGVIAFTADGGEFALAHIYTDGNAHVGSLLYGATWRVAKALGYRRVWI